MASPANEPDPTHGHKRFEDEDGTVVGEKTVYHTSPYRRPSQGHLRLDTERLEAIRSIQSPSRSREEAFRFEDDLAMLQVERQVSATQEEKGHVPTRVKTMNRSRSRRTELEDDFDLATDPTSEKISAYTPPKEPNTNVGRIFKQVHNSFFLFRYIIYITPLVLIILIPLLLGALLFKNATVGGVRLMWFSIWLEIVWLSLWAGRILAKCLPWPIGLVSSLFTNNSKKWRDMGKQLEMSATMFFWWLAIEISFIPTMTNHHIDGNTVARSWEISTNKVFISTFVCAVLNLAEKIVIQLIAINFHLRTYSDRIELNKFQIGSLTKLYRFSRGRISLDDREFELPPSPPSGTRTPKQLVKEAQKNTVDAMNKFGDVAGKIAGDFTGREVAMSSHPHQVILTLLSSTPGSQVLARRLYRTFAREDTEKIHSEDLGPAFDNANEADTAFTMFDKDMNGDISMEELEAVCVEIGRERKSITASLKDLDSVVSKLNDVLFFIVVVIAVLVLVSLISTSAASVLTSLGSTVLALSWLFSATAQEFLQSIIFVFVKHPFDVGDRVGIYGNTGSSLKGDDYYVKEISLLYTEFKKMEGHVVQAPNSYLNTLFILNQRRSGGLAEAIPVVIKFGTTLEQIDSLRQQLLEFVTSETREYQANILTELRDVTEVHSLTLNVVFFYKSNWQNELLRLQRRNKFICALMVSMQELGIEGPRMRLPGQKESIPVYLQKVPQLATSAMSQQGNPDNPDNPDGDRYAALAEPPFVEPAASSSSAAAVPAPSSVTMAGDDDDDFALLSHQRFVGRDRNRPRRRGETLSEMGRRVDFSLGVQSIAASNPTGDVFDGGSRPRRLSSMLSSPTRREGSRSGGGRGGSECGLRSLDIGRSSSVSGNRLMRIGTDSSMASRRSNHRNRFFGRRYGAAGADDDGADDYDMMESGMARIPEHYSGRLDPRTGTVSSKAWRHSKEEARPQTGNSTKSAKSEKRLG